MPPRTCRPHPRPCHGSRRCQIPRLQPVTWMPELWGWARQGQAGWWAALSASTRKPRHTGRRTTAQSRAHAQTDQGACVRTDAAYRLRLLLGTPELYPGSVARRGEGERENEAVGAAVWQQPGRVPNRARWASPPPTPRFPGPRVPAAQAPKMGAQRWPLSGAGTRHATPQGVRGPVWP